jgi:hypothetical protein
MKTLRQTCAVVVLALLLSAPALAGQVKCPGVVSPPPPPDAETTTTSSITTSVILALVSLIS